ncbi:MAG: aminotransferase class I/II-fold pyridoxal phosphate-dependent enzyme [Xanthomonadales bacterium]|nr:aminotransferase class I/II-fold pyridoxal phosphate-dependent enzyme [Xanthomonadales bacterium]NIX13209.1 aminotransferase class I/II-fold pyridoxal phosphate-dependent enzyme [Xanthomonadales bacterium]
MDITALARPEILDMQAYASARSSMSADGILLNANEAPGTLLDDPGFARLELNRYPAPQPAALVERLAGMYGIDPGRLLVTRGSDEGIDLLVRVFCRAGRDAIAECPPCFGMYRIAATIQGADVISVPRLAEEGFRIDADALTAAIQADDGIRIVFLTSPANPTGDSIAPAVMERVLEACRDRCMLVLDEAYIEFSGQESASGLVADNPQLVVLRTLSKAWAAAGLRCGSVIANPEVIDLLRRVMAPYPLTAPAVDAALRVTDAGMAASQREMITAILRRKGELVAFLEDQPWVLDLWPGDANFVLLRAEDAEGLSGWCGERNIRIRNFHGQPMLDNCVRLSIGSDEEMGALTAALDAYGKAR